MSEPAKLVLSGARQMAPRIAAQAQDAEAARRLPPGLVAELKALGIFRMGVASRYGGLELDLPSTLPIIEALSAADGAVGWNAMNWSHAPIVASLLPLRTLDRIYADGPDVVWTTSLSPAGVAEVTADGFRVTGRWPFASGCDHAQWMFANCVLTKNGKPLPGSFEGVPAIRAMAMPAAAWRIEDTWFASGLRGSGSSHICLDDVFVPEDQTLDVFAGRSTLEGPLYVAPVVALPGTFAAVALGIARGALADVVEVAAPGKRRMAAHEDLRDSPVFHHALGGADAGYRASQAILNAEIERLWAQSKTGSLPYAYGVTGAHTLAWVAKTCAEVVDTCYTLAGGDAVYETSRLQRRLRDVHAVTQHKTMNLASYTEAGAALVGHKVFNPLVP